MVVETAIQYTIQALWHLGIATGATLVLYPLAVTMGGGVTQGDEDQIVGQLFTGLLILTVLLL